MNRINWKKIGVVAVGLSIFSLFVITHTAFADPIQYTPLVPLPGVDTAVASDLPRYLVALFKILIGFAAVLAIIEITVGGIEYMSTDAISGKEDGKERITQAIYGLLLAMGAWIILYTVNPALLTFTLNPAPIQDTTSPSVTATSTRTVPTVQIEAYRKVKICQATDTYGTTNRKTVIASFPFEYANLPAQNKAYDDCKTSPPAERNGPAGSVDCPAGFTHVIITCERVLDFNAAVEEENQVPLTANIIKQVQCKQRNTHLITNRQIGDPFTYNPAEQGGRQRAIDLCTSSDPIVGQDIFPDHCGEYDESETIRCIDAPNP